ncbi:hypothetical protein F5887DRAFT_1075967 [Amanita rubescens]|nr:hypothetical protein F5887DRAFT_1075967 [Amanita rubescens]
MSCKHECPTATDEEQLSPIRMWLNNHVRKHQLGAAVYIDKEITEGGKYVWTSTIQINGTDKGYGEGSKKADARDKAAKQALANLLCVNG